MTDEHDDEASPTWAPAIIMAMRKQLSPEGSDDTPIECSDAEIEGKSVAVACVQFRDGPAMQFISDSGPLGLLTMLRVHMRRHLGLPDCDARDIDALRIIEAFGLGASYEPSQPMTPWSVGPLGSARITGCGASLMEALFHCFNAAAGNTTKGTP